MPKSLKMQSTPKGKGNVQKSPSSKATTILARGAYIQYVSTAKWRERRWWLFSTFPIWLSLFPTCRNDPSFRLSIHLSQNIHHEGKRIETLEADWQFNFIHDKNIICAFLAF